MRAGAGWFPRRCGAGGLLEDGPCFLLLALFYLFLFIFPLPASALGFLPLLAPAKAAIAAASSQSGAGDASMPARCSFPLAGPSTEAGSGHCRPGGRDAGISCTETRRGSCKAAAGRVDSLSAAGLLGARRCRRGVTGAPSSCGALAGEPEAASQSLLPYVEEMLAVSSSQSCCT